MDGAANLIRAVADLLDSMLWPLVALLIVYLFRGELPGFVRRMRRLVFRAGERSIEVELAELEAARGRLEAGAEDP